MAVFCIAQSLRSVSFLLGQTSYLCSRQILSSSKTLRCIFAFSWSFFKKSLSSLYKVFLRPAPTYASPDRVLFFSQRYLGYYVGAISPSGQLRHHRLPLLQVTLIHPAQFSHKRALCLSTTFSISGLARHVVILTLSRFSRREFASTHQLTVSLSSSR